MHELSRTPTIPDRAGQSGQLVFAMGIQHATAWPATQGAGEGDVAKSYWLAHDFSSLTDADLTRVRQELRAFHAAREGRGGVTAEPTTELSRADLDRMAGLVRADLGALKSGGPSRAFLYGRTLARTVKLNQKTGRLESTLEGDFEPVVRWLALDLIIEQFGNIRRCKGKCPRFFFRSKGQKFCSERCSHRWRIERWRHGKTKEKLREIRREAYARELERQGKPEAAKFYRRKVGLLKEG